MIWCKSIGLKERTHLEAESEEKGFRFPALQGQKGMDYP